VKVKLKEIKPGQNYSRVHGIGCVKELAASLDEVGLLNPIIIDASMNLISGFRRFAAANELQWDEIDVTVKPGKDAGVINLVENLSRQDLSLWEEIQGIKDVFGDATDAEICRRLSKSKSWAKPRTAVWGLPQDFIDKVRNGVSGVSEIKRMLSDRRGPSASSVTLGFPNQVDIKRMITWLVSEGRDLEAKCLSYAVGGLTEDELKTIDYTADDEE
jgi:ParB/RepB/Spo0J family partition protein